MYIVFIMKKQELFQINYNNILIKKLNALAPSVIMTKNKVKTKYKKHVFICFIGIYMSSQRRILF